MPSTQNPMASVEPWNLVAAGYAAESSWVMQPFALEALRRVKLRPEDCIIDVAAGSGVVALAAAPQVATVHAVDFSHCMLEQLQSKAQESQLTNVSAILADGQQLPFDDDRFDAGFSMFGLMFFPDRAQGFQQLHRVLKPGAPALVSSWAPAEHSSLMQVMFDAIKHINPDIALPAANLLSLENPAVFRQEFEAAGFVDVDIAPHTVEVQVDAQDTDAFWSGLTRSSAPLVMLRERLGESTWQERSQVAKARMAEQVATRSYRLATTAYLGLARKPSR